jgi:FkbM family methyltransferase
MRSLRTLALAVLPPRVQHAYRVLRHVLLKPFEEELALVARHVRPNTMAIDVGANTGLYSHVMARHASRVLALEPDHACASYLRALRLPNTLVAEVAASDAEGKAVLRAPIIGGRSDSALGTIAAGNDFSTTEGAGEQLEQTVRTVPLDVLLVELGVDEPVSFVKIDVEGHELAVLNGARKLLSEQRPAVLVELELRHGISLDEVFGLLGELGHRGHVWRDGRLSPITAAELGALQSEELLAAKQRDLSFKGYVNNVLFLPA